MCFSSHWVGKNNQFIVKCQPTTAYPFSRGILFFHDWFQTVRAGKGKKKKLQTMQCGRDWLWDSHEKWEINSCGGIPHSLLALYFQCCVDDSRSESEPFVFRWVSPNKTAFQKILRGVSGKAKSPWEACSHMKHIMFRSRHQNNLFCAVPGVHTSPSFSI